MATDLAVLIIEVDDFARNKKHETLSTFARPDAVSVRNAKREVDGEHVDISFSPHSFTVLEMQLD